MEEFHHELKENNYLNLFLYFRNIRNMPFINNIPCPEDMMITNVLIKPKSSNGLFLFSPDLFTYPSYIFPMDVSIFINSKGDLKISLLDDNQTSLFNLVLKCSQYDSREVVDLIPNSVRGLYEEKDYTEVLGISASNIDILKKYIEMEEAAYTYRFVSQSYLDLWNTSEKRNGIMQYLIRKTKDIISKVDEGVDRRTLNTSIAAPAHCVNHSQRLKDESETALEFTEPGAPPSVSQSEFLMKDCDMENDKTISKFIWSLSQILLRCRISNLQDEC
jgi:hypothetical protein